MRSSRTALLFALFMILLVCSPALLLATRDAGAFAGSLRERGIPPLLVTGLISMIPIFELRGGIPVGIALFKLHPVAVYFTCLIFNLIPVLPILLLLNPLRRLLSRVPPFRGLFRFLEKKAAANRRIIERYEEIGLTLFVAVPLPVTGAWTGSIVAEIMGLKVIKSFLFIALGVALAGIIVTMLTMLRIYGLAGALVILLTFLIVYIVRARRDLKSGEVDETEGKEHNPS